MHLSGAYFSLQFATPLPFTTGSDLVIATTYYDLLQHFYFKVLNNIVNLCHSIT